MHLSIYVYIYRSTRGLPMTINSACARVVATLNRFGLSRKPMLCLRSNPSLQKAKKKSSVSRGGNTFIETKRL